MAASDRRDVALLYLGDVPYTMRNLKKRRRKKTTTWVSMTLTKMTFSGMKRTTRKKSL
jgi:hypothetical protein